MFFEIARAAKEIQPRYLFLENVKGLLSHAKGETFGTILRTLDELGYDAEWQCINSKDYVPQNRDRVYIIGHLRGECTRKILPFGRESCSTLKQIVGGRQGERVYSVEGVSTSLCSGSGGLGAKTRLYLFSKKNEKIKIRDTAICIDANHHKGLDCHQQRTGVLRLSRGKNKGGLHDELSPAITSNSFEQNNFIAKTIRAGGRGSLYKSRQNWDTYEIDGRIRKLTPRECWRLQGFPDSAFDKAAKANSDKQLYKQAGSSVTVNVIYEIAKKLI